MSNSDPMKETRWTLTALLFTFVVLKLAGVTAIADWSWLWVLSPFWIPVVVALVLIAIRLLGRRS